MCQWWVLRLSHAFAWIAVGGMLTLRRDGCTMPPRGAATEFQVNGSKGLGDFAWGFPRSRLFRSLSRLMVSSAPVADHLVFAVPSGQLRL